MTEFVLVRHGETVWHAENRYAGISDVALTDTGRAQAEHLATWAAAADLSAVVSSPLTRACETAGPAARAAGLDVEIDPRLVEVDFGAGEGLTAAEMEAAFPAARAAFRARPASCPLPGGEPGAVAVARARPALDERADDDGGRVLVVAHQTLLRLLVCALVGIPLDAYRSTLPRLDNVARTVVRLRPDTPAALLGLNLTGP